MTNKELARIFHEHKPKHEVWYLAVHRTLQQYSPLDAPRKDAKHRIRLVAGVDSAAADAWLAACLLHEDVEVRREAAVWVRTHEAMMANPMIARLVEENSKGVPKDGD